jgi:multiple sugar transport system substrate-binding protein
MTRLATFHPATTELKIEITMTYLRRFSLLIILIISVSCNNSSNNDNNVTQLTYWSANNQYEIDLAEQLIAEWYEVHPDVRIKHQPIPEGRSSEEVVLAAVVGKTTPDIYSNMWPGDIALYVRADALAALDQFHDFDSVATERFSEEILQESRFSDGHVYHILWKTNPIMMAYNIKLFADVGIHKPPATYEEYLAAAEKITRDTDGDGYVDQWVGITQILVTWWQRFFDYYPLYIAASGGKTLIENNDVAFDNEISVEVFRFLQTLFAKNYFPKERMDARADVFMNSVVATRFVGPWTITQIERHKPKGFEYDFAPIPKPDSAKGPAYTYGDYKSIIIFKNSKYKKQAWEFVKFLISKTADLKLLQLADQLPIRKNILQEPIFQPYFEENPKMIRFAEQAQYVRGVDNCPVLREVFDAISQEFEAGVIYGTKSAEEAVKAAAERARLIIK